jgi:PAS domain S-box-containing protein
MSEFEPSHLPAIDPLGQPEVHFGELVANVRDYAIFMLSPTGIIRSWNAGAQRYKGYAAHEIIGKHFSVFYTPDKIAAGWPDEELRRAQLEGRFEDEGWRVRKDGTQFWANVVITPLFKPDGSVRGFLKITRDLSERQKALESLRLSEERFRLLVEGVKDHAIFMLDPEGRVMSWNAGAQRIKGYTADEIIGQHFSRFYSSEDVESGKPQRQIELAIENGSVEDEGWRVRKDRSLFWANVVITAVRAEDGSLMGFAKVTRDLTQKRKSEELELADRQKNEFMAMLAHELRNPLAPISNGLQLLKVNGIDSSTLKQTTEMMDRQLSHLVRLVDDLLDVSRVVTGKMAFEKQAVDLATVVHRAVEETEPIIDARGHELMLTVPARPIIVDADLQRLAQVVSNLVVNAAKYTDVPSQIWLSVEKQGDEAVIRVKDTGIGIPPELLPKIFDLFTQVDNSLARTRGGLGIGLHVVRRIVEAHGGTVVANSAGLGLGSEFVVRLPISQSAVAAGQSLDQWPAAASTKRRVLVVDDNADAATTTCTLLKAWGHDVQAVHSGPAAIERVREFQPQIILLDIGLPGMSGYEVAKHVRQEPSSQGVVIAALTGYGQEADRERSRKSGFDYHLTKPADPALLASVLAMSRDPELRLSN